MPAQACAGTGTFSLRFGSRAAIAPYNWLPASARLHDVHVTIHLTNMHCSDVFLPSDAFCLLNV